MNESQRYRQALGVLVPVILALALAGVCIWASEAQRQADEREAALVTRVETAYRQAYYQLSDNINDMQTALKKLSVTGSPSQHVLLLADVWRLSGAASASMGSVPSPHVETSALNAFIVRTGDYAHVLAERVLKGGVLTGEDYQTISELYEASVRIGNELKSTLDADGVPVRTLSAEDYFGGADSTSAPANGGEPQRANGAQDDGEQDTASASGDGADGAQQAAGGGTQDEDSISNYPTLIYDGPFSESNETAKPRGLPAGQVEQLQAQQAAMQFLGGGTLQCTGQGEGVIPVYLFSGTDANGRNTEITVSREGGAVLWMMADIDDGADGVPDEATVRRMRDEAARFLGSRGYKGMEATYAQFYNGRGVFNFAATQDGVILYGDLIKVYVERATCAVCGVDANNYLMFHTKRSLPTAAITQQEAAANVSERLSVESVRLALIPKTASTETLCYEFKGKSGETSFIVYINALSGAEEQIFEIIDSEDGQLVV